CRPAQSGRSPDHARVQRHPHSARLVGLRGAVQLSLAVRPWAPMILMAASGFAGLGYEILWTQQCSLWLGHESAAVLAVVTAFFGGIAAGSVTLASRIEASARPARWYAGCELFIGLFSLAL